MRSLSALTILAVLASCSSLKTSSSRRKENAQRNERRNQVEIIPSSPRDEEKIATPKVIESDDAPESTPSRTKAFAVYIDASGFDAFVALGFLQELEKVGIKPVKIMGAGFGCYAALSWAAENNGNQAEWEALKFESWNSVGKGSLVGRIVSRNSKERFKDDVFKNFAKRRFSDFRLPVDCPVVQKKYPFSLKSAEFLPDIGEVLWTQLQTPSLARPENFEGLANYSGIFAADISDREWIDLSKNFARDSDFGGWLYIKTRTSFDVVGDDNWSYAVFGRLDRESRLRTQRKVGNMQIFNLDLSYLQGRNPETLMDSGERRKFLLEGRKRAAQALPRVRTWLQE